MNYDKKIKFAGGTLTLILLLLWMPFNVHAQDIALKTNVLYWSTLTPNIGAEVAFAQKHSAQLFYGLNPWKTEWGKSTCHWVLQPEYRYWFCEAFNGWFVGAHLMGGEFNLAELDLPLGIFKDLKDHRYEGWFAGGGVTAGYQWMISPHLNLEASVGIGYDYIQYDKYKCGVCGEKIKSSHANYFGPTKAALSIVYIF